MLGQLHRMLMKVTKLVISFFVPIFLCLLVKWPKTHDSSSRSFILARALIFLKGVSLPTARGLFMWTQSIPLVAGLTYYAAAAAAAAAALF